MSNREKIKNIFLDKKLWLLLLFANCVRLYLWHVTPIIASDGAYYIRSAKYFKDGDFFTGLQHPYHPLYQFLIYLGSFTGMDFEVAGRIISLILGICCVGIVYVFFRKVINARIAFIAALILAFHPYAARLSVDVRSDITYLFFYLIGFGFGYFAIETRKAYLYFIAGISSALAYLTRPEGISILIILSIWILLQFLSSVKKSNGKNCLKNILLLSAGFIIVASPYLTYLKYNTGEWVITPKENILITHNNIPSTDKNRQQIKTASQDSDKNQTTFHKSINKELPKAQTTDTAKKGEKSKNKQHTLKTKNKTEKKYFQYFFEVINKFIISLHYPLLLFLLIGIRSSLKTEKNKLINNYIISYSILFLLVLFYLRATSGYISYRHPMSIVFISLLWVGIGINVSYYWLGEKVFRWKPSKIGTIFSKKGIIFLCLIIILLLPKTMKTFRNKTYCKDVSQWINAFYPEETIILTNELRIAYYADIDWIEIPDRKLKYNKIVKYAKRKKIPLLVIKDSKLIRKNDPYFFSKINQNEVDDIKEIFDFDNDGEKIFIYWVSL